jgi:hypothetical protein
LRPHVRAEELLGGANARAHFDAREPAPSPVIGGNAGNEDPGTIARELRAIPRRRAHFEARGERPGANVIRRLARDQGVGGAEAHVAHRGLLEVLRAPGDRLGAGAGLPERDRHAQVELEAPRDAVRPEERAVHLVVDRVLTAAAAARGGDLEHDRPRQVVGDDSEADPPRIEQLGPADADEARRPGVRPQVVGVDAGRDQRRGAANIAGARGRVEREAGREDRQGERPRTNEHGGDVITRVAERRGSR